jgi:micrococcal nuclease
MLGFELLDLPGHALDGSVAGEVPVAAVTQRTRMHRHRYAVRKLAGLLVFVVLLSGCAAGGRVLLGHQAPATWSGEPGGYETATVVRVVDGDTAEVKITGRLDGPGAGDTKVGHTYSVRFLGIDTPESVKPNWPVECFGHDASDATRTLLQGKSVRLVKDTEETDQYGRILRYIYLGDEMVNARLVANGYARVLTYSPNVRHADLFVLLAHQARAADRGLWSPSTCDGKR